MNIRFFIELGLSLLLGRTAAYLAPLHGMDVPTREPHVYIVAFHKYHTLDSHWQATNLNLTQVPKFQHHERLNMYTTTADSATLDTIRADRGVALVEASFIGKAPDIREFARNGKTRFGSRIPRRINRRKVTWNTDDLQGAPWGLRVVGAADKLSTPVNGSEGNYDFVEGAGLGTWVFIFDCGIRTTKAEFGGRASDFQYRGHRYLSKTQLADEEGLDDKNGHGTFVAGVVGAEGFGVAPHAKLLNVKVILSNGNYVLRGVVSALNDVAAQHELLNSQPLPGFGFRGSVINMAWLVRSRHSPVMGLAIASASTQGLYIVAGAGNFNKRATLSPCTSPWVYCVGSIDQYYRRSRFSNWGPDVKYQAPGENITSLGLDEGTTDVRSGTALAAAHLAGAAAIFTSWRRFSERNVNSLVWANALKGKVSGLRLSRNILVNTGIHNLRKDDREPFEFAGSNPAMRYSKGDWHPDTVSTTPKAPPPQTPAPPPPPPSQGMTLTSSGSTVSETMPTTYKTTSLAFSTVVYHPTTSGSGPTPTETDADCEDYDEL